MTAADKRYGTPARQLRIGDGHWQFESGLGQLSRRPRSPDRHGDKPSPERDPPTPFTAMPMVARQEASLPLPLVAPAAAARSVVEFYFWKICPERQAIARIQNSATEASVVESGNTQQQTAALCPPGHWTPIRKISMLRPRTGARGGSGGTGSGMIRPRS